MTLAYTVNENDVLAVECQFSPAGASPGAIWAQFKPKQTHQKTILNSGSKSALTK